MPDNDRTMAKNFTELRRKMSLQAHARSEAAARKMLREIAAKNRKKKTPAR